jgi:Tfp pilus assembly protein FimV
MIHPAAVLTVTEVHREAAAKPPADIVVRRGDSLSGIAARYRIVWPGLYEANRKVIGSDPDLISPGQHLRIPSAAAALRLATAYRPVIQPSAITEPVTEQASSAGPSAPSGSFQACVIARESGGNAQVMNATGHYGLYQFSYSTWVANGGSAADFGNASVAEQNQVFANAYAASGTAPWAPYDGC